MQKEHLLIQRDIDFYEKNILKQSTSLTGFIQKTDSTITVNDATFMTVQYNSNFAQQRLAYAIAATQEADRKVLPFCINGL